jgi:hypothetical protein
VSDQNRNVTFNIGQQTGVNTTVAGDMTVHGGQQYIEAPTAEIRAELTAIRDAVASLELEPEVATEAGELIAAAEEELERPEPRVDRVGSTLERLTGVLTDAGALAAAGAALIEPLRRVASFVGSSGQAILQLLR